MTVVRPGLDERLAGGRDELDGPVKLKRRVREVGGRNSRGSDPVVVHERVSGCQVRCGAPALRE